MYRPECPRPGNRKSPGRRLACFREASTASRVASISSNRTGRLVFFWRTVKIKLTGSRASRSRKNGWPCHARAHMRIPCRQRDGSRRSQECSCPSMTSPHDVARRARLTPYHRRLPADLVSPGRHTGTMTDSRSSRLARRRSEGWGGGFLLPSAYPALNPFPGFLPK